MPRFLEAIWSNLTCFWSSLLFVPQDSNVALYTQVCWLCCMLYMPMFDSYCWRMSIHDFFYQNQLVARQKHPFHFKGILSFVFVLAWELSRLASPWKPAIELPCNLPFSTEMFSRESFDSKYTQANLMDLLTYWQVQLSNRYFLFLRNGNLNNKETSIVGFFLPLPIPSTFLSLICIISTEFRIQEQKHSLLVSFPNLHNIN